MIAMQVEKMIRIVLLVITGALVLSGWVAAEETLNNLTNSVSSTITGDKNIADIPDLVGLWNTESVGTALFKSKNPGEFTHHQESVGTLTGQVNITEQDGRVLHATFTGSRGSDEKIIGVIYFDNTHIRFADMDGFFDLEIIDNNTMYILYSQNTVNDSAVAVGIWNRVKDN